MNEDTWLPKDLNIIGDCNHNVVANKTVEQFLQTKGVTETFLIDDEHYNYDAHKLIAEEFVPYI